MAIERVGAVAMIVIAHDDVMSQTCLTVLVEHPNYFAVVLTKSAVLHHYPVSIE
jgi:hypothetical protein